MLPSLHMLPLGSPALHEETGEEIERLLCDIGEQLRLAKLVDLGDDTGVKAGKEKAPAAKPYDKSGVKGDPIPKVLKEFAEETWDLPTYKGEVVKTVKHQITNSTEIERAWLRKEYGGNWSSADKELKAKMQKQARTVLSFEIAPKIICTSLSTSGPSLIPTCPTAWKTSPMRAVSGSGPTCVPSRRWT